MSHDVRRLVPGDAEALQRLEQEAFGVPPQERPLPDLERPERLWWGSFNGDRLVAAALDHVYEGWFGGRTVPVSGIGGVTVAAEARGTGALRPLVLAVLDAARERGAVVSTLFPSAPGIYRRLGYESVAALRRVDVPSSDLAAVTAVAGVVVRRAEVADAERVRTLYDTWAAAGNGPLTRRGASFPATDAELVGGFTGITLAEDAASGELVGYAAWTRGRGDDIAQALSVAELLATRVDGYAALLRTLGSFGSVAPTVQLRTTGEDVFRHLLPTLAWRVVSDDLVMLAVLDVEAAFAGLRCSSALTVGLGFRVAGAALPGVDGAYVVAASGGLVTCARGEVPGDRTLAPRGLALLLTGALPCREIRALGLLTGGDLAEDATWDALVGGRFRGVLDEF